MLSLCVCSAKADLVFNGPEMLSSMNLYIEQLTAEQVVCSAEEACLSITPQELAATRNGARLPPRHLLRFTTAAWNRGNADFRPPPAEPQWHACHRHYHSFDDYATYDLVDERGMAHITHSYPSTTRILCRDGGGPIHMKLP